MFTKKVITALGVIATVFAIFGGIWAFNGHYATNQKVDVEIQRVEFEVAGAIQSQSIQNDYKFYQFLYDKLTNDMYKLKRLLAKDPDNTILRSDYEQVVRERQEIKRKMDDLMKQIRKN